MIIWREAPCILFRGLATEWHQACGLSKHSRDFHGPVWHRSDQEYPLPLRHLSRDYKEEPVAVPGTQCWRLSQWTCGPKAALAHTCTGWQHPGLGAILSHKIQLHTTALARGSSPSTVDWDKISALPEGWRCSRPSGWRFMPTTAKTPD